MIGFVAINLRPYAIIDFKYRNYPDYLAAFKAHQADPENEELYEKLEEEKAKMQRSEY